MSVTTAADGIKEITTPLSDADVESLKAGDRVRISGVIYTARDAAHARLFPLLEKGETLPVDVKGTIIYYTRQAQTLNLASGGQSWRSSRFPTGITPSRNS